MKGCVLREAGGQTQDRLIGQCPFPAHMQCDYIHKRMPQTVKGATVNPWLVHVQRCAEMYKKEKEEKEKEKEKAQKKRKVANKTETKAAEAKVQKQWAKKWSAPP